ncbi:UNVERIFIED_CONTAM: Frataxin [Trichonephila clavipes]
MLHIIQKNLRILRFLRIQRHQTRTNVLFWSCISFNNSNLNQLDNTIPILNKTYRSNLNLEFYSNISNDKSRVSSPMEYEHIAEETLQSLSERFEELLENSDLIDWDVTYSNDVLTVSLNKHNVYVINKQSPNKQIWLSSPFSGPKRYDFINETWIYKHDGVSLHQLLSDEISKVIEKKADFKMCTFGESKNTF